MSRFVSLSQAHSDVPAYPFIQAPLTVYTAGLTSEELLNALLRLASDLR